jgi:hypothetical protein
MRRPTPTVEERARYAGMVNLRGRRLADLWLGRRLACRAKQLRERRQSEQLLIGYGAPKAILRGPSAGEKLGTPL